MAVESECIVCIMRQALDVCEFVGVEEDTKQSVLKQVMQILISAIDESPEDGVSYLVHKELKKITKQADPYKNVKEECIKKALELYPRMIERINGF